MKRLDTYLLSQIAVPAVLAVAVISFVAVAAELRGRIEDLPVNLITAGDLARLFILFLPSLMAEVIAVAFLLGILLTLSRLARQGELTAMKAAGIPLRRVIAPIVVCGALLSGLCFFIQDRVQPWAIERAFALMYRELPQRLTIDVLTPGIMHEYEGWRVYFGRKDPSTGTLYDIDLVVPESSGGNSIYHFESATSKKENGLYELVLVDGYWVRPDGFGALLDRVTLPIPEPSAIIGRGMGRRVLGMAGLFSRERAFKADYQETRTASAKRTLFKERREISERLSMPFAALAVAFLAAPLGVRAARGGRADTFAIGFGVILIYYVLQILMAPSSLHSLHETIARAWAPNLILIFFGLFFMWRADRV